jgi:hypothetical protein
MRYGTLTLGALGAAALLAACSGHAEPTAATLAAGLSPAHCVAAIEAQTPPDTARCPGFLFTAVNEARDVCRAVDGTLVGADDAAVWTLDVNRDGAAEFVYEHEGNVACEGAYSVFSCGSLGCPKSVYENRNGAWQEIAGIFFAYEPEQLVVLDAAAGDYAALRVGCTGNEPCSQLWFFDWNGSSYERTRVAVRGFDVDLIDTINGLYPLAAAIDVRATPAPDAASVGRYEAGTHVAIVGTATTREHYYVSPCNACESGFVPLAAVVLP